MIALKQKLPDVLETIVEKIALAEALMNRLRCKMTSRDHQFKKTDRIDIYARYPQYREQAEAANETKKRIKVDVATLVEKSKSYNSELFEKLRRFFEFLRRIFKRSIKEE